MTIRQKVRALRLARKTRVRAHMMGTAQKPRLSVTRSNRYVFMQAIDDVAGRTISGIRDSAAQKGTKTEKARSVAVALAKELQKQNINQVIFDRGPYKYHGRIQAVAEALREAGIKV